MKKRALLAALVVVPALCALAAPGGVVTAVPVSVYTAAPTFVPGWESSMAFTPTADPTLLAQLDNQQGSDADSTIYSQAFQVSADGTVDTISWWGTGSSQTGFMVALQDGVWGSSTSLPNGPVVEGVLAQLSVVPIAQVTRTPAANGETMFQISIPATHVFASHAYRLSVTAVGGTFEWDNSSALGCCTGTSAVNWVRGRLKSYLAQPDVSFSLDNSGSTAAGLAVVPAALPPAVHGTAYRAACLDRRRWQRPVHLEGGIGVLAPSQGSQARQDDRCPHGHAEGGRRLPVHGPGDGHQDEDQAADPEQGDVHLHHHRRLTVAPVSAVSPVRPRPATPARGPGPLRGALPWEALWAPAPGAGAR